MLRAYSSAFIRARFEGVDYYFGNRARRLRWVGSFFLGVKVEVEMAGSWAAEPDGMRYPQSFLGLFGKILCFRVHWMCERTTIPLGLAPLGQRCFEAVFEGGTVVLVLLLGHATGHGHLLIEGDLYFGKGQR